MRVTTDSAVTEALDDLRSEVDATLLLAVDHGSRDARLMDPDSDRDVAFLAAHHPLKHGQTQGPPDMFHHSTQVEGTEINIAGLSLSRFASDAAESSSTALDMMNADCTYYVNDAVEDTLSALRDHIREQFNPPTHISHFRRLARSNYNYATEDDWTYTGNDGPQWTIEERGDQNYLITGLLGYPDKMTSRPVSEAIDKGVLDHKAAEPTVRQNLRIARSLLSAQHIFETGHRPPAEFDSLVDARCTEGGSYYEVLSPKFENTLRSLAEQKRAGDGDKAVGLQIDAWATPIITADEFSVNPGRIVSQLESCENVAPTNRTPDEETINSHVTTVRTRLFDANGPAGN